MISMKIKRIILGLIIIISTISCAKSIEGVNNNKTFDTNTFLILDFEVKLYLDEESDSEVKKLNYFDPLIVLSESANSKGRIKIKLQNGAEGWVYEKYTSHIPIDWIKKSFDESFYFYILPDQLLNFKKREKENNWIHKEYRNNDYYINYGMFYIMSYSDSTRENGERIKLELAAGDDKKLNWSKEFNYGNYKVNYVITTNDPNGWIIESFDFIKLNEVKLKKVYSFSTTYKRSNPLEQRLNQRKILFSALQSLQ